MAAMTEVRTMGDDDIAGAEEAFHRAITAVLAEYHLPVQERTPERKAMHHAQMRYLLESDPLGSWVADDDGEIVGVAQANIRGDRWFLALLGVAPGQQDRGLGRGLLNRAVAYGRRMPRGGIFASPDPRAMYRYLSAGFELHPTAAGYGPIRRPIINPTGIRSGSAADDTVVRSIDLRVRGVDRDGDVTFLVNSGYQLRLADDDRGYVVAQNGRVAMLSALDEDAAGRLLRAVISGCPTGEPVDVSAITAQQQWAFAPLMEAGVSLRVDGSVMMRGAWQPTLPYLASGGFG